MSFWDKAFNLPPNPVRTPTPAPAYQQPAFPTPSVTPPAQPASGYSTTKAQSQSNGRTCPDCGSGNFFKPSPNSMEQCYHCGWNPRFSHSTAGGGLPSGSGQPTTPSRQVSTSNNFNPQHVVAKVS